MQEGWETTYKANKISLVSVIFSNRHGNFKKFLQICFLKHLMEHLYFFYGNAQNV